MSDKDKLAKLAIEAGISDDSFNSILDEKVPSYSGTAIIEFNNEKFKCVGHPHVGHVSDDGDRFLLRDGFIEFLPII